MWQAWVSACHTAASEMAWALTSAVVIHYARFERPFLERLGTRQGPQGPTFQWVCTHAIAQRLFPGLPRRGIRALAGYLGHDKPELKRAAGHVEATAAIWAGLVEVLQEEHGVRSLEALQTWLKETPVVRSRKRNYPIARDKRLSLPRCPGVYRMLDRSNRVLYVGKATSLRQRVNSYFRKGRSASERHLELVTRIWDVEVTPTASPLEAALLETDAIKHHDPPYNIALKTSTDRALVFATPDLQRIAPVPDALHCLGPLPSSAPTQALASLVQVLDPKASPAPSELAQALLIPVERLPTHAVMIQGLARVRDTYGFGIRQPLSARALLAAGAQLWLEFLQARQHNTGPSHTEESDSAEVEDASDPSTRRTWTVDDVEQSILSGLLQHARAVRRASGLCQFSEASVAWTPTHTDDAPWRILVLEGGQVSLRDEWSPTKPLPLPPGHLRTWSQRQTCFDAATYDRLRILTTELRRVLSQGGQVRVRFGHVHLGTEAARRLLTWL
ncbi:MAG: GIY-YIG nuclease family protein [Myxococcota bacterium]